MKKIKVFIVLKKDSLKKKIDCFYVLSYNEHKKSFVESKQYKFIANIFFEKILATVFTKVLKLLKEPCELYFYINKERSDLKDFISEFEKKNSLDEEFREIKRSLGNNIIKRIFFLEDFFSFDEYYYLKELENKFIGQNINYVKTSIQKENKPIVRTNNFTTTNKKEINNSKFIPTKNVRISTDGSANFTVTIRSDGPITTKGVFSEESKKDWRKGEVSSNTWEPPKHWPKEMRSSYNSEAKQRNKKRRWE